ncbi:3-methyl-2-oxobutanoate hydroxymethyltransferase [Halogeometricum borinquense]|uniref:3-methyl-2-oxobutanoate hydroxymethyltransferase n=1 Tax=Halogeometricum borinquense TaxID=60847 RepID=A0A482T5B1_9EURY|nr:3-methyl-2-oxobutanoate hydroxymethyltransferase [Halogeometricum borinquense]RYJ07755.1 3-methyl-2-oxobutanoate hydroxymethyltransferase [Halogeometricum borinquense]
MTRTTVKDVLDRYESNEPLTMLTAYDAPMAQMVDEGGVDMILVGDSAAHNHMGHEDTLPLTMDEALMNTGSVVRGTKEAMIIADMPFLSYGASMEDSVENAGRFIKEAGADAVKLETASTGGVTVDIVDRLTELGIPVQGHIGLTPQRMKEIGGPVIQGRGEQSSAPTQELVDTALELEEAGIFSLVLETVTEQTAREINEAVNIPTIGIGAGRYVDGQVLVLNDLIGLKSEDYKLSKQYADIGAKVRDAVEQFVSEVRKQEFPTAENAYEPVDE